MSLQNLNTSQIIKLILVLGILGLITSIYLFYDYYINSSEKTWCDLSETISCSAVKESFFSELFGLPLAFYGMLWFLVLIYLSISKLKQRNQVKYLLGWNILGLLFVTYFIFAEIRIKSICPLCTFIHLIVLTTFIFSIKLYLKKHQPLEKV